MELLVVSHTHWDREWYHGAGTFRQRLVALVDELLDRPAARRIPFLLDGQAVVVEDYLALRPERSGELAAALRDGWMEAGPWYVLADELIPGGEALARNLLAGRAVLRRLGASAPPVLYSPDAFGHAAALPALAYGFALPVAVVWRGYGGRRWPEGDAARWRAPGGEAVVLYHLPPSGYELGSNLPPDDAGAARWWAEHRDAILARARLDVALLPNGADHHALQDGAAEALDALARAAAADARVRRATLGEFARRLASRAGAAPLPLPEVRGELRDSYGYTWTLQGTLATRAAQKRRARQLERLLVRDVEPWLALSAAGAGPSTRAALAGAWRTLLRCHPHDTLCGCSTDEVARAMDARLESGLAQARALRETALHALVRHDPVAARTRQEAWAPALVVRNAAARPRGGVVEARLDAFVAHVPVGPGSRALARARRVRSVPVVGDGSRLVQSLGGETVHDLTESPRHYPDCDLVHRTRALLWLDEPVPPLGTRSLALGGAVASPPSLAGPRTPVTAGATTLDNGELRVEVDDAGRVTLVLPDGRRMEDLLGVESVGDVGDTYTHSPAGEPSRAWAFAGARLEAAGPLRGTLALRYLVRLPRSRTRARPSRAVATIPLTVRLSLDAAAPFVRIAVAGDNRARDHRLRLVVRSGVRGACHADAAFGTVLREPLRVPGDDQAAETVPPTAPLHRYVSLFGAERGATLYADGLAEYEATPDGELLVTLVRAVGALSRNDLPERDGHAGWPAPTPSAQCPGPFEASFALLPHGPRTGEEVDRVERVADDVLHPLAGATLRSALHLPPPTTGPSLSGTGLALGAVKPADEEPDALVLRCVNLLDRPVEGRWTLGAEHAGAWMARLDEHPGAEVAIADGGIRFTAAPRAVVTMLVRRAAAAGVG